MLWSGVALQTLVLGALLATIPARAQVDSRRWSEPLRSELTASMEAHRIPGLAAALVIDGKVTWIDAIGWADIAHRRPMTTETVLNVGSVSKLVTSTAVMSLVERGRIDLDGDVNRYLPFSVRHPEAPEAPITMRQLLTHVAGIHDSQAYADSYACGDPAVSLEDWLEGYLTPGGRFFSEDNFLPTPPGAAFEYSNVGYGLLGLVVEQVAGESFSAYTGRAIFSVLGMKRSGWFLRDVAPGAHATPYWLSTADAEPDPEELALLPQGPFTEGELVPFCLYSFPNYPDGLLRTSIQDLAAFVVASQPGDGEEGKLLGPSTRAEIFRDQLGAGISTDGRVQGLGWRRIDREPFGTMWGHGGADPGIRAQVLYRPEDGVTVIVVANRLVVSELVPILKILFDAGGRLAGGWSTASCAEETGPIPSRPQWRSTIPSQGF